MIDAKKYIQEHESIIFRALAEYRSFDLSDEDNEEINNAVADLQEALTTEAEYFAVNHISKDDLKGIFEDNKKAMELIDNLTEDDLGYIAIKTSDGITDSGSYAMALQSAFENWSENK